MYIDLTDEQIEYAKKHAPGLTKARQAVYAEGGQGDLTKNISDNVIGKLCEIAVYRFFKQHGIECTKPDFKIHQRASFAADMTCCGEKIHVKGQSIEQSLKNDPSWVFQYAGKRWDKEIFKEKSGFCVFCILDGRRVYICALVRTLLLHMFDCFQELKAKKLREEKKAVYLKYILSVMSKEALCYFVTQVGRPDLLNQLSPDLIFQMITTKSSLVEDRFFAK